MRSCALFGIVGCLATSGFVVPSYINDHSMAPTVLPTGRQAVPRDSLLDQQEQRTIAVDDRLAATAGLAVGDAVVLSAQSGEASDTEHVRVGAILEPSADPAAIARSDYRIRMHLDQLQS